MTTKYDDDLAQRKSALQRERAFRMMTEAMLGASRPNEITVATEVIPSRDPAQRAPAGREPEWQFESRPGEVAQKRLYPPLPSLSLPSLTLPSLTPPSSGGAVAVDFLSMIWNFTLKCCWPSSWGHLVKIIFVLLSLSTFTQFHPLIQLRGLACNHNFILDTVLACPMSYDLEHNVAQVNDHVELLLGRSMRLPLSHSIHSVKLLVSDARSEILKSGITGKPDIVRKYSQIMAQLDFLEVHTNRLAAESSNSYGLIQQEVQRALHDLDSYSRRLPLVKMLIPDDTKIAARFEQHTSRLENAIAKMETPLYDTVSTMKAIEQEWVGIRDDWAQHSGYHREYGYSLGWCPVSSENQEWRYNNKALAKVGDLIAVAGGKTSNISIHVGPLMAEFPTLKENLVPQDHALFSANIRALDRSLARLNSTLEGVQNFRSLQDAS